MCQVDGRRVMLHSRYTSTSPSPVLTLLEPTTNTVLCGCTVVRLLRRRGGYYFPHRPNKIAHDAIPLIQEIER